MGCERICSLRIRPSSVPFSLPSFPFSPETPDTQAKGYGDLGLSSQNLRDQAARLEKNAGRGLRKPIVGGTDANLRVLAQKNESMDAQTGGNSTGFTSLPITDRFIYS